MRKVKSRNLLLAATALVLLALLPACDGSERITAGGRLVYGLTLAPSGIDPHVDASSELGIPLTSVYDTLVYQDLDGTFVPGLAERWEISQDGRAYTFYLRPDVKFHDGTEFDANAVRFNLDRIASPETMSRKAASMLGTYSHTEIVDDHTVRVHFTEPYAPFLDSLSQVYLGMASPTAVQEWGAEYQLHQVGTGPFIFQEYVPNDHLTLIRNLTRASQRVPPAVPVVIEFLEQVFSKGMVASPEPRAIHHLPDTTDARIGAGECWAESAYFQRSASIGSTRAARRAGR